MNLRTAGKLLDYAMLIMLGTAGILIFGYRSTPRVHLIIALILTAASLLILLYVWFKAAHFSYSPRHLASAGLYMLLLAGIGAAGAEASAGYIERSMSGSMDVLTRNLLLFLGIFKLWVLVGMGAIGAGFLVAAALPSYAPPDLGALDRASLARRARQSWRWPARRGRV